MNAVFADPDWRGEPIMPGEPMARLRPLASLAAQEQRLADWIRGGACYGWLNAYEARRAAFELQAIRAQRAGPAPSVEHRLAAQSRLDRLEAVLEGARRAALR
ncbi:MAG TPA: hypothetical protein VKU90_07520 [Caulobacteraceae bacterium]|nr:hypothetical protein [Caulobacteraceae bacterium]